MLIIVQAQFKCNIRGGGGGEELTTCRQGTAVLLEQRVEPV